EIVLLSGTAHVLNTDAELWMGFAERVLAVREFEPHHGVTRGAVAAEPSGPRPPPVESERSERCSVENGTHVPEYCVQVAASADVARSAYGSGEAAIPAR